MLLLFNYLLLTVNRFIIPISAALFYNLSILLKLSYLALFFTALFLPVITLNFNIKIKKYKYNKIFY